MPKARPILVHVVSKTNAKLPDRKKPVATPKGFTRKGWYLAGERGFPTGAGRCFLCNKGCHPGDVVYAKKITVGADLWAYQKIIWMHKECMQQELESSPFTQFDTIKKRLEEGEKFFG